MNRLLTCLLVLACVALGGCVRDPGGIAPSNVPLSQGGYQVVGPATASDCKVNLFGIIPVSGGNQISDAVNNAIRSAPGSNALVDISVDRVSKYFILWTTVCTEIRAIGVKTL